MTSCFHRWAIRGREQDFLPSGLRLVSILVLYAAKYIMTLLASRVNKVTHLYAHSKRKMIIIAP